MPNSPWLPVGLQDLPGEGDNLAIPDVNAKIAFTRAELAEYVTRVKKHERACMARDIHDELGGNLTAIKMALAMLIRLLPDDNPVLREKASYADSLTDRTMDACHRLSQGLPPPLLALGVVAAIQWQASEFTRQTGIPCRFSCNKDEISLPSDQASALVFLIQEALTNIAKHAQASRARVTLLETRNTTRLKITDNGCGIGNIELLQSSPSGIRGMAGRVRELGGKIAFEAVSKGGSLIRIEFPRQRD